MSTATSNLPAQALLFVPDISGFTQFVKSTEIDHGRHIIEELLEGLIEANELGLQVSEVEGDAILFYRFGSPPTTGEFFEQVRKMFIAFHARLRVYESRRICDCGACSTMHDLTLKIVAHFGNVARSQIKEHSKLFGPDVILVHRLLKNEISHHEYALFTHSLAEGWPQPFSSEWAQSVDGSQAYDVGEVRYRYVPLAPLRQAVPEPKAEDFSIPGVKKKIFSVEQQIRVPMRTVIDITADLPQRVHWMEGAKRVELLDQGVNHVGMKHRCIIDEKSPVMVTTGTTRSENTVSITETDVKRTMCSVYTFQSEGEELTRVRIDGFIKNNLLLRMIFALVLKKKLTNLFEVSGRNLKKHCEESYSTQATGQGMQETRPAISRKS
jgi:Protein of unknown function (DUF2652)